MKRLPLPCLALFVAFLSAGCLFAKKNAQPKESPAIAAGLEVKFKQTFLEKRSAELRAAGLAPAAAQAQAEEEFRVRYGFTSAAKK